VTNLLKEDFTDEPFLLTLTFSLEGKVSSANLPPPHSRSSNAREWLVSGLILAQRRGRISLVNHTCSFLVFSHEGEVFSTNLPFHHPRLLTPANGSQLTSFSLKGEEDLTSELFRSTLAFSLEGGGVLYEPTFLTLETSIAREQFATDLIFAQRRGGFNWRIVSFDHGVLTRGGRCSLRTYLSRSRDL